VSAARRLTTEYLPVVEPIDPPLNTYASVGSQFRMLVVSEMFGRSNFRIFRI